jgi:hypothetical protein
MTTIEDWMLLPRQQHKELGADTSLPTNIRAVTPTNTTSNMSCATG